MCLIVFAFDAHPAYKLILAANRDEFTTRPARAAHFWRDADAGVVAGVDVEAGGTWLGITKQGRFAALTNYRDVANIRAEAPSRGNLTQMFLRDSAMSSAEFAAYLKHHGTEYNGFNILWGNFASVTPELFWYSNYTSSDYHRSIVSVPHGIHGVSNALLNTPWFKVERAKSRLAEIVRSIPSELPVPMLANADTVVDAGAPRANASNNNDALAQYTHFALEKNLVAMLQDRTKPHDDALLPSTGVSLEWERMLSSMFIETPDNKYGTRSSSVVVIDRSNNIYFSETRYTPAVEDFPSLLASASVFEPRTSAFSFVLPVPA